PGNSVTVAANDNLFSAFAALPPGSLLFLSTGPLGGVNGPAGTQTVTTDRVELGDLNAALLAALIRLTILTPVSSRDSTGDSLNRLTDLVGESVDLMQRSWERFLDGLFSMTEWLHAVGSPSSNTAAEEATEPEGLTPLVDPISLDGVEVWDLEEVAGA